jgi:hypothetical protein
VATAQWYVGPSPSDNVNLALLVNPRDVRLHREGELADIVFSPSQLFTIIPDNRYPGEYKASTLAYIYSVRLKEPPDDGDDEIVAWHWHPLRTPDRPDPHIHVTVAHPHLGVTLSKLHIPSGRVAFEEVLRFLIDDLSVIPVRPDDWRVIVGDSEARFKAFRTWA